MSRAFSDLSATHVEVTEHMLERALKMMPQPSPRGATAATAGAAGPAVPPAASSSSNPSSIVNKPARGWLHPDHLLAKEGINYAVRVS